MSAVRMAGWNRNPRGAAAPDRGRAIRRRSWLLLLAVYVAFMYGNSLTPGRISSMESGFLLEKLYGFCEMAGIGGGWLTEHMLRKTAHFVEYMGFGILLAQAVRSWVPRQPGRLRLAGELAWLVPFVDETLQLFVQGRSGQISDVWLDMSGALCGLALSGAAAWLAGAAAAGRSGRRRWRG